MKFLFFPIFFLFLKNHFLQAPPTFLEKYGSYAQTEEAFTNSFRNLQTATSTIYVEKAAETYSVAKICPLLSAFVLIWMSCDFDNSQYFFKAQKYNIDGSLNGAEIDLFSSYDPYRMQEEYICTKASSIDCAELDNGYLAVTTMDKAKFFVGVISPENSLTGNTFANYDSYSLYAIRIANLTTGNFVLVYHRSALYWGPSIGFLVFDKNINILKNITLCSENYVKDMFEVLGLDSGKFVIVWSYTYLSDSPYNVSLFSSEGALFYSHLIPFGQSTLNFLRKIVWFANNANF